jgi:hypothetical protein
MQPLPQSPAPDWRQYVLRAIIWVSFVGALGYAAANGGLGFLENDVSLSVEANRDSVPLAGPGPALIEMKVTLRNNTRADIRLESPTACKILRWQIFSRSGDLIQSKVQDDLCPATGVSVSLAVGQKLEEFYSIQLASQRFRKGDDYQVHVWYWGYESQFQFKAE